jgi:DNA repair protein RadC
MDEDLQLIELRAKLAQHGLFVEREKAAEGTRTGFLVRGRTLQLEPALSGVNAVWDSSCTAWRLTSLDQLFELTTTLQASENLEIVYTDPSFRAEAWHLREDNGPYFLDAGRLPSRTIDPAIIRLAKLPPEALETNEVLAVLLGLGTSFSQPQQIASTLVGLFGNLGAILAAESGRYKECLPAFSSYGHTGGLEGHWELVTLLKTTYELFQRVLKEEIKERPVIGSWTSLVEYLQVAMQHETAEHFRILFLDRKNILIRDEVQSRGTVDHTPLYPREVLKRALELAASAIIMVHNHPSGDPTPSPDDIEMTKRVAVALAQVGITVHDHIIVGKNRHTSFRTCKLL